MPPDPPVLITAVPEGRKCKLCSHHDQDIDPLAKSLGQSECMYWGAKPKKDSRGVLRNQGAICGYCNRTWLARFKH
eukprot:829771-Lingulodinium_polyedra.AAC.1